MLANGRFYFLLFFLLLSLAVSPPVAAQVHGLPPSVTSIGFDGSDDTARGIPPSVTSLGPNNFVDAQLFLRNCCSNYFWSPGYWPSGPMPPLAPRRRHHHDDQTLVAVPAYIPVPYAVPYATETDEDSGEYLDADDLAPGEAGRAVRQIASSFGAPGTRDSGSKRAVRRNSGKGTARDSAPKEETAAEKSDDSVTVQPTTVLVFKDGHRSDVVNYAIVGDALFDFAEGRARKILLADLDLAATRKANDDRGVDFQIPPAAK